MRHLHTTPHPTFFNFSAPHNFCSQFLHFPDSSCWLEANANPTFQEWKLSSDARAQSSSQSALSTRLHSLAPPTLQSEKSLATLFSRRPSTCCCSIEQTHAGPACWQRVRESPLDVMWCKLRVWYVCLNSCLMCDKCVWWSFSVWERACVRACCRPVFVCTFSFRACVLEYARVDARLVSIYVCWRLTVYIRRINIHLVCTARPVRACLCARRAQRGNPETDRSREAERILIISVCQFNFQRWAVLAFGNSGAVRGVGPPASRSRCCPIDPPARSQRGCVYGWRVAGGKNGQRLQRENKGSFWRSGWKFTFCGWKTRGGRLTPELQGPPTFYTARLEGNWHPGCSGSEFVNTGLCTQPHRATIIFMCNGDLWWEICSHYILDWWIQVSKIGTSSKAIFILSI